MYREKYLKNISFFFTPLAVSRGLMGKREGPDGKVNAAMRMKPGP
jgi:hypothetical protein